MNLLKSKKDIVFLSILLILALIVVVAGGIFIFGLNKVASINSFEECAKIYPVQESFPERCTVPNGKTFVKKVDAQDIEITGQITCLPHKDKEGPQTLECAIGLQVGDLYYSLSFKDNSGFTGTGKSVFVRGKFTPSTDQNEKYDIVGRIEVASFIEFEDMKS